MGAATFLVAAGCAAPGGDHGNLKGPLPEPVAEQTEALLGANLGGSNLGGSNLGGSNLGGSNLGGPNLGGSNLGGSNLGGSNLGGSNLGGNNLGGSNLGGSNLGGSNLGGSNLGGSNLGGSNLGGSNLGGSNLGGSNLTGNNLGGSNLGGSNLGGSNTGMNIHGLTGSINGMLYSGEDLWLPKTGQCVVMGIGSTAFPKLLGQQTANAKMNVALGKLPWGFSNTAGGPIALNAWEAVVWGDKTYCVFVLAAPPGTAWSGVAGFIKSIFRWNAPPTQAMDISGIEASSPFDPTLNTSIATYAGMMDSASRFRAGNVADTAFVAGELAFATATTNNQSIMVDFASWVQDKNKNPVLLGNVEIVGPPTYAESVYVALDNGDGTTSIVIDDAAYFAATMPSGLTKSYADLNAAYATWKNGQGPKPIPLRCGGALDLAYNNPTESVPLGKCDSGLVWSGGSCTTGSRKWSDVSGRTTGPNTYMQTTQPNGSYNRIQKVNNTCGAMKNVLSETYVHMWTKSYNLNRAYKGTASSTGTITVPGGGQPAQSAAMAFDNLASPSNGTQWSVVEAPSPSAPISLGYKFQTGSSYAINSYSITSAGDYPGRDPREWQLQGCGTSCSIGSDTGWTTLDTRAGEWFSNRWQTNAYSFTNSTPYAQFRLQITGTASIGGWQASASVSSTTEVPAQAIDGSYSTRWTTGKWQAPGQSFQVDMLTPQTFYQIAMNSGSDYPRGYQVFVSNDGVTWGTPIATGTGVAGVSTVTFAQQTARYLRVVQTGSATVWWSITEFSVLWSPALPITGWVASASSSWGADVPARSIDGAVSTRWTTGSEQAPGKFFSMDMGTAKTFTQIAMNSGSDFPASYQVFVSNDGSNWGSAIATGTGTQGITTVNFPAQTARYWRMSLTGTSTKWWSIYELSLYRDGILQPLPTYVQLADLQLFDSGSCTPESDAALCASSGKNCGAFSAVDSCGASRTIASCGSCTSPNTCAGGGVANVCGSGSSAACYAAYSQSSCGSYSWGTLVSNNGRNWTCKSSHSCSICAMDARYAPGGTGGYWGPAWQDNGACQ